MKRMKKVLYTNKTLFTTITNTLKEKGLLPDILDYSQAKFEELPIKNYEFDILGDLNFGGNEGIYLEMYIEGYLGNNHTKISLGTFKTLNEDIESLKTMAVLQANFMWYCREFVGDNLDDFTWEGRDVDFYKGDERTMGYTTRNNDSANRLIKRYYRYEWDYVIITNNENGKTTLIKKAEVVLE